MYSEGSDKLLNASMQSYMYQGLLFPPSESLAIEECYRHVDNLIISKRCDSPLFFYIKWRNEGFVSILKR